MNIDKALETIVKHFDNSDYFKFEYELLRTFKEYHSIEDLYFYTAHGWFYCSDKDPRKNYNLWPQDINTDAREILIRLAGTKYMICFDGQRFDNLEDLKRHHLTKKLAGI